jgi:hypothetical protein
LYIDDPQIFIEGEGEMRQLTLPFQSRLSSRVRGQDVLYLVNVSPLLPLEFQFSDEDVAAMFAKERLELGGRASEHDVPPAGDHPLPGSRPCESAVSTCVAIMRLAIDQDE